MQEMILILDFGSQYTQLIAKRIRDLNVYCEIHPWNKCPEMTPNIKGIILSGSPYSVNDEKSPHIDLQKLRKNKPILAIGFGAHYLIKEENGKIKKQGAHSYNKEQISLTSTHILWNKVEKQTQVWMSHGEIIEKLPTHFNVLAKTQNDTIAAFEIEGEETYGFLFHPEVFHSTAGDKMVHNFVKTICEIDENWTPKAFANATIARLKKQLGNDRIIMGLSGGVDSTVAAVLLHKAIGKNLHCIFVDSGLLRKNEYEEVLKGYEGLGLNVKGVDASQQFYGALKGLTDPEAKRKAIGKIFVDVFEAESKLVENAKWLGQGTIYPDIIESVTADGSPSKTIKSHHNVGGLPDYMKLKVVEPLRLLFKDEVRRVGKVIDIPTAILNRHPFPGPGLGIRILGEVTEERVKIIQQADAIFINSLKKKQLYNKVWQAGAILLPVNTVGVSGDKRTYENAIALRAVSSIDGMTADWVPLPYDFLGEVSNQIINQVDGINRVTYDISSKPPATIEWE